MILYIPVDLLVYGVRKSARHRPNYANLSWQCGKLADYVQTMRELVVPVRVNVDTDWHAFMYSS